MGWRATGSEGFRLQGATGHTARFAHCVLGCVVDRCRVPKAKAFLEMLAQPRAAARAPRDGYSAREVRERGIHGIWEAEFTLGLIGRGRRVRSQEISAVTL